jgi:hypothetical protein
MRYVVAFLLLGLGAWSAACRPAAAQAWLDQPGLAGTQRVQVGRATVTLPPGQWVQGEADTIQNAGFGAFSRERRVYFQFVGPSIHAAALIISNNQAFRAVNQKGQVNGWGPAPECSRHDVFFFDDRDTRRGSFNCMMVNHNVMPPSARLPWSEALGYAGAHGGWPRPMIEAVFSTSGPAHQDSLFVAIYVDPALAGFAGERTSWQDSLWHPSVISADRRAYENKVVAWAKAYRPIIESSWP